MTFRARVVCLGWAAALAGAGCVTSGQGEAMRKDTADLRARLDAMDKRYADANEQMDRLRKVLDQATALLTRNSADVGAKVAKTEVDVAALSGRLEEAQHILDGLQKRANDDGSRTDARLVALETNQQRIVDRVAPSMPEDKESLWKEAQTRVTSGQRDDARRFLRAFVQRFPQDARAAEAQLDLGRTYTLEAKHTQAAAEYQRVIDSYPKSAEVPEAMYQLGLAFVELKFCGDARALFLDLAKRYPRFPKAAEIKNRARDLQKKERDPKLCTS